MSNKNKKKSRNVGAGESDLGTTEESAESGGSVEEGGSGVTEPAVTPVKKTRKVYAMASDMSKQAASRGAPQATCEAARAFLTQVEAWRETFFALKTSGWEPSATVIKSVIKEGDPIAISPDHVAQYSAFIPGLAEGSVKLVAGSVDQVNKMIVQVMLKGEDGKFYAVAGQRRESVLVELIPQTLGGAALAR